MASWTADVKNGWKRGRMVLEYIMGLWFVHNCNDQHVPLQVPALLKKLSATFMDIRW
ncbi:hypothetical protein SNOG_05941 [Parastagonospora nodorum SN15]|uniref:Uncharacterized protein n=1 Tax=Phaeosphaeria nodorum (strain SN15 / ATCC MYA-4574 / FGSC 10173) TaxID=321614 RepID=Q0UQM3_PHANO|nr:hypothetical protein SNOG_05941 [Parastagonospora nodorum SN15]EAT87005.1 hypothetical protein SNOG_05941 [Parastagonospora nodorum SN15]